MMAQLKDYFEEIVWQIQLLALQHINMGVFDKTTYHEKIAVLVKKTFADANKIVTKTPMFEGAQRQKYIERIEKKIRILLLRAENDALKGDYYLLSLIVAHYLTHDNELYKQVLDELWDKLKGYGEEIYFKIFSEVFAEVFKNNPFIYEQLSVEQRNTIYSKLKELALFNADYAKGYAALLQYALLDYDKSFLEKEVSEILNEVISQIDKVPTSIQHHFLDIFAVIFANEELFNMIPEDMFEKLTEIAAIKGNKNWLLMVLDHNFADKVMEFFSAIQYNHSRVAFAVLDKYLTKYIKTFVKLPPEEQQEIIRQTIRQASHNPLLLQRVLFAPQYVGKHSPKEQKKWVEMVLYEITRLSAYDVAYENFPVILDSAPAPWYTIEPLVEIVRYYAIKSPSNKYHKLLEHIRRKALDDETAALDIKTIVVTLLLNDYIVQQPKLANQIIKATEVYLTKFKSSVNWKYFEEALQDIKQIYEHYAKTVSSRVMKNNIQQLDY